ncbi:hypothetical protein C8Q73DRAFT_821258 [Cubamyces lactineus]|nr:hypothetical protein C8Q73DRAFT_821258 [Cubamyces lactineus]
MCYVNRVPAFLSSQQIIASDELWKSAVSFLQAGSSRYVPTVHAWDYAWTFGPNEEDDPYKLKPIPGFINLRPQSHFGLGLRDEDRLRSIVPPLDPSNAKILVPKYHTFLEGHIHFVTNPPTRLDVPRPHLTRKRKHGSFITYLVYFLANLYDIHPIESEPGREQDSERDAN